jgi:pyruvate kinase
LKEISRLPAPAPEMPCERVRRAKIICTIGPACDSEEMIRDLMRTGMDVARLNFSHGTHPEHARRIQAAAPRRASPEADHLHSAGPARPEDSYRPL